MSKAQLARPRLRGMAHHGRKWREMQERDTARLYLIREYGFTASEAAKQLRRG